MYNLDFAHRSVTNHFCYLHNKSMHIHVNIYKTSKGYIITDVINYPSYKSCTSPSYPFDKTSEIESLIEHKIGHKIRL